MKWKELNTLAERSLLGTDSYVSLKVVNMRKNEDKWWLEMSEFGKHGRME